MDVSQFQTELYACLSNLNFVNNVLIEQRSVTYIKIIVNLTPKGFLSIWYNAVRGTLSFSLILENSRKWGYDFDNRIGWHEHPLSNPEMHLSAKSKTIAQIVENLQKVWNTIKL